jgi:hypothetical protein
MSTTSAGRTTSMTSAPHSASPSSEVIIYTHKIDGLHRSDFVLAAKMDARYGG